MAGRKRSNEDHHPSDQESKRAHRMHTGESPEHPIKHSQEAREDAGYPKHHQHEASTDVDETAAKASLLIDESRQRDQGESVPVTPYSRGQA